MTDLKLTDGELEEKVRFLAEGVNVSGGGTNSDDLELQDVVNSKDEVIGTLPRGVIWDNGLQSNTRVTNVFVVDGEGKILLPVRSLKKRYLPGGYDFSCGENLTAGESYETAVLRGLIEELGVEDGNPKEVGVFSPDPEKNLFCFGKVYLLEVGDKSEIKINNTDEIERLEWRTKEEILQMIDDEPEKFKRDYKAVFDLAFGS